VHVGRQGVFPYSSPVLINLFYLTVHRMLFALWTILFQLHPTGIITTIFLGRIVPLLAFRTLQGNNRSDTFLFCHVYFTMAAPLTETTMSSFL
jgi:hypothetical protein